MFILHHSRADYCTRGTYVLMRDVNAASWPAANESVLFFVVVPPLSAHGPGSRNARLLAECAKSLRAFSYHFALIDNGVETVNNSTLMRHLAGDPNVVILEGNHFYSLGAFTVAWKYLSSGGGREICESCHFHSMVLMQHSVRMVQPLRRPRCSIETLHHLHSQRSGIGDRVDNEGMRVASFVMRRAFGRECSWPCFLTDANGKARCTWPCVDNNTTGTWNSFAHNSVLFSASALFTIGRPLTAAVPSYVVQDTNVTTKKIFEVGAERLWGILSSMLGGGVAPDDTTCGPDPETFNVLRLCNCPTCCSQGVLQKKHGSTGTHERRLPNTECRDVGRVDASNLTVVHNVQLPVPSGTHRNQVRPGRASHCEWPEGPAAAGRERPTV